jgi:hypothetical protein
VEELTQLGQLCTRPHQAVCRAQGTRGWCCIRPGHEATVNMFDNLVRVV